MDPIFQQEQEHLSRTYERLQAIEAEQLEKVQQVAQEAMEDKDAMSEDLTMDLADFDATLETLANIESLNRIVDSYNISHASAQDRLNRVQLLLKQPYFAKVQLQIKPDEAPRDIYLGVTGMADDDGRTFIVDWRSPVAETYYNQGHGKMSYVAHGRTITVDLLLRRQFDLDRDQLHSYFDTTIAIEDPLLLQALAHQRGSQMKAITATIQKEQNAVIRHEDVPVLLVRGIAGSGKTSVLLQRIAYLLYQHRDDLRPDQVHLISPNPVFSRYISHVLPDMGEHNPQTTTWAGLAKQLGIPPKDRGKGEETVETLRRIDEVCQGATIAEKDCRAVRQGDDVLIPAGTVVRIAKKFSNVKESRRQCARITEELHDQLDQKILRDAATDEIHGIITDLSQEEQCRRFGAPVDPFDEDGLREASQTFLEERYAPVHAAIDDACWLSTRRLGQRLLGNQGLKPIERAYLKLVFAGTGDAEARYVMVDEVQDYSVAQFMVIARCFPKAHFLLLGDPNQAIFPGSASFDEIRNVFAATHGSVSTCALMTSYRSSPEITALFAKLSDERDTMTMNSVRRPGLEPTILSYEDPWAYRTHLSQLIEQAEEANDGLTAIVAANAKSVETIHRLLGDMTPHILSESESLPDKGVLLMELRLAKGLEFDRVIIPDAQRSRYGSDDLSRHWLYTAISRATREVVILADGPLTRLLGP